MVRFLVCLACLSALLVAGMLVLERFQRITITIHLQPTAGADLQRAEVSPFAHKGP